MQVWVDGCVMGVCVWWWCVWRAVWVEGWGRGDRGREPGVELVMGVKRSRTLASPPLARPTPKPTQQKNQPQHHIQRAHLTPPPKPTPSSTIHQRLTGGRHVPRQARRDVRVRARPRLGAARGAHYGCGGGDCDGGGGARDVRAPSVKKGVCRIAKPHRLAAGRRPLFFGGRSAAITSPIDASSHGASSSAPQCALPGTIESVECLHIIP